MILLRWTENYIYLTCSDCGRSFEVPILESSTRWDLRNSGTKGEMVLCSCKPLSTGTIPIQKIESAPVGIQFSEELYDHGNGD